MSVNKTLFLSSIYNDANYKFYILKSLSTFFASALKRYSFVEKN